jgi:hypothetical protein
MMKHALFAAVVASGVVLAGAANACSVSSTAVAGTSLVSCLGATSATLTAAPNTAGSSGNIAVTADGVSLLGEVCFHAATMNSTNPPKVFALGAVGSAFPPFKLFNGGVNLGGTPSFVCLGWKFDSTDVLPSAGQTFYLSFNVVVP